jgi:hypothetical protein
MISSHDRFELSVRFNKQISDEGYRAARDQALANAQPAWLYSENSSQRQMTLKCMAGDEKSIKASVENTAGVTSVYARRVEMGALTY